MQSDEPMRQAARRPRFSSLTMTSDLDAPPKCTVCLRPSEATLLPEDFRMTSVWLWDAFGPVRSRGVTDNPGAARRAAEGCLHTGADSARVENALMVLSASSLTYNYARLGTGWSARLRNDRISWRQLDGES